MPCVSDTLRTSSSPAYLAIPYGSTGSAGWSSLNGALPFPYRAMLEQYTKRFTRLLADAASSPAVFS